MATLRLKDSYRKAESLVVRNGVEGMIEVTKAETIEVSALVASHYYGGNNIEVCFLESDREELLSLPEREANILTSHLKCRPSDLETMLLPEKVKPTVPEKLKASAKKAVKKATPKKTTAKKTTPKKDTSKAKTKEE